MATKDSIRRWVRRHHNKHKCLCGCDGYIDIKPGHHSRGIPKFIKGHNFSSDHNPRTEESPEVISRSASWEVLSDKEKERRLANLVKFGSMEEHPGWKGGKVLDDNGYIHIRVPDHPFSVDGYVLEHRYVMEQYLAEKYPNSPYLTKVNGSLYLKRGTVVHHVNERKSDNRLVNLFPFPDDAAHTFWHKSNLTPSEKISRIKSGIYRTEIPDE